MTGIVTGVLKVLKLCSMALAAVFSVSGHASQISCANLCTKQDWHCIEFSKNDFDIYPTAIDELYPLALSLSPEQKITSNLGSNGVLVWVTNISGISIRGELAPVNSIEFKRSTGEQLRLDVINKNNGPVLTINDVGLGILGGKLTAIEFIDSDPIVETAGQNCLWLKRK